VCHGGYVGNGPNFMVKAIAEKSKVHTPGFIGYIVRYSLPILVPILALVGWIMVHGALRMTNLSAPRIRETTRWVSEECGKEDGKPYRYSWPTCLWPEHRGAERGQTG